MLTLLSPHVYLIRDIRSVVTFQIFVQWVVMATEPSSEDHINRGPNNRGSIDRAPINREPINRDPINRGSINCAPISRGPTNRVMRRCSVFSSLRNSFSKRQIAVRFKLRRSSHHRVAENRLMHSPPSFNKTGSTKL